MSLLAASKFNDINPTTTSNSKVALTKSFIVSRTTTASTQFATLPAAAYITCVYGSNLGAAASNAATTAVINIFAGAGATQIVSADVKTAAAPNFPYATNMDVAAAAAGGDNGDQIIKAQYAETGTASSAGGPWLVTVEYVV